MPMRPVPQSSDPGHPAGVDMSQTVTGPPSEFAQASLEAEIWRLHHTSGGR
jgi:hypothetical protein